MLDIKSKACGWNLVGNMGTVRCGPLAAQVDLNQPQQGLHRLKLDGLALRGSLWCIAPGDLGSWPAMVCDQYIRGSDLVAAYASSDAWPYASQLYWSAIERRGVDVAAMLEMSLLVSIQTSLLDTHPRVEVKTHFAAEQVLVANLTKTGEFQFELLPDGEHTILPRASASCLIWRFADQPMSYAEVVEECDFRKLQLRCRAGKCESRWQLFAEFLEKGVIRRARIHAAFLPRKGDVEYAAAFCRRIEQQPLPLTT